MADYKNNFGFEDLEAYQAARQFRTRVLKLANLLPAKEKYALDPQIRRAALSITNNIAEGYGRHNWQENIQFCRVSRASLMEVVDDINTCMDMEYAKQEHLVNLKDDALVVLRLLNGYINYLNRRKNERPETKTRT